MLFSEFVILFSKKFLGFCKSCFDIRFFFYEISFGVRFFFNDGINFFFFRRDFFFFFFFLIVFLLVLLLVIFFIIFLFVFLLFFLLFIFLLFLFLIISYSRCSLRMTLDTFIRLRFLDDSLSSLILSSFLLNFISNT